MNASPLKTLFPGFVILALSLAGCSLRSSPASWEDPDVLLWEEPGAAVIEGWVLRVVREVVENSVRVDTIPVADAWVWAGPETPQVFSDSVGYFSVSEGLQPGRTTIRASREAMEGATVLLVEPCDRKTIAVILGEDPRDVTELAYDPVARAVLERTPQPRPAPAELPARGRARREGGGGVVGTRGGVAETRWLLLYRVRPGDTFSTIAASYHVRVRDILEWNGLRAESVIRPGDELRLVIVRR